MTNVTSPLSFNNEEAVLEHYKKTDDKVLIYKGKVYNVADYVQLHPGGADYIEEFYGKNVEEAFEE